MAVKSYRCIVGALTIRSQPQTGDSFKTGQQLRYNDVITINEDSRVEAAGFAWLKHDKGWSAERSLDGTQVYLLDAAIRPRERMWGINIDPYNPTGNPQAAKLTGLGWVRFVFHAASKGHSLEQAFAFYDPIIRSHVYSGTKVMLILIHDTYRGNAPWQNGDWNSFIRGYAETAAAIARHYRGLVSAYEIWNEQDQPADQQSIPTSIFIPPQTYGTLLLAAAQAIKLNDPLAKVITGGLVSSNAIAYMTAVQNSLGGSLPVDGIAIHPYGLTPPNVTPFPGWSQGSLTAMLINLADRFPRIPIWITEIGVPRVDVNNRSFWPGIANYMIRTFQLIQREFAHLVPALIWFAWSDSMDRAGIVTDGQQPKGAIFDTFISNLHTDQPTVMRPVPTPYDGKIMLTHIAGQLVGEQTIGELAQRINALAGNVRAVLVRSSAGTSWQGANDSKRSMAINGPGDLSRWTVELTRYRLDLHAWHEVWGSDSANETNLIAQVAQSPGVQSLVLDLDPARLALRDSSSIRSFMVNLRRALPGSYHIGLSFDGRPDYFKFVNLLEWYPFINSWHPKVFHWSYSSGQQGPANYLSAMINALQPYLKPIIPMLQAEPAPSTILPEQIRQAARLSFESYNLPGISYWRLGAIGTQEFATIQAITVPWAAGMVKAPSPPDTLVVQTTAPLRIRTAPSLDAAITGFLQPGEQITVLERRVLGAMVWVRYDRGWSLSRNGSNGEIYLA